MTNDVLVICDVECIFIFLPKVGYQLFFMLDDVRYCFEMKLDTISEQEKVFLEICENAIQTKYKAK